MQKVWILGTLKLTPQFLNKNRKTFKQCIKCETGVGKSVKCNISGHSSRTTSKEGTSCGQIVYFISHIQQTDKAYTNSRSGRGPAQFCGTSRVDEYQEALSCLMRISTDTYKTSCVLNANFRIQMSLLHWLWIRVPAWFRSINILPSYSVVSPERSEGNLNFGLLFCRIRIGGWENETKSQSLSTEWPLRMTA